MKRIVFTRQSKVHDPGCYNDAVQVYDDSGASIYAGKARTYPNPYRPSDKADCTLAYGCVAPGKYPGKFYLAYSNDDPFIKCILINSGWDLPCVWPNTKHGGQSIVSQVFVHHGWSPTWSGSAGCQTIPPDQAPAFFALFNDGEAVEIEIVEGAG